jgi:hypothetical protein
MSRFKSALILLIVILTAAYVIPALAYNSYHPEDPEIGCFSCHSGFDGRGPLHDMHVGNRQMTANCQLCHVSSGDNPSTWTSGEVDGQGCRGCHGVDNGTTFGRGAGLRLHHLNAGAPADANGDFCADCHTTDPAPSPESTVPVYYSRTDVDVKLPCNSTAADGEDWNGDGEGLDNDGDLAYDENDTDCGAQTGVTETLLSPPRALTLLSINPNPVMTSRGTEFLFGAPTNTEIKIQVFDVLGRSVFSRSVSASRGWQRIHFNGESDTGRPLPTGIYLVRLTTERETALSRMTVLR